MKKFLSLVLAVVMTFSLVTISAGAKDFTDNSKITYNEAVDVVSACKIIDGYTDGSFNPQNTLTRGAAAKIICNLMLGPTTAGALATTTAPFKDVAISNTFAGYIAYCSSQGIISGYADGTFRPAGTLTGYAFMKMLLGALGYDTAIEGYTGSNWSVNVAKQAKAISLDDGNDAFVGSKAVTREEACLYAFNTLKATMVDYDDKGTSITINGATITSGASKAEDVKNTTKTDGNIDEDDLMQFAEKYFTDLKKASTKSDDYGRPASEWKYKNDSVGTYANDADYTYTGEVTRKALYNDLGKDVYDDLTATSATKLTVVVDGKTTESTAAATAKTYLDKNSTKKIGGAEYTGNGVKTEVYVDDDNNVTICIINTYVLQATDDYSSKNENVAVDVLDTQNGVATLAQGAKLSADDFDVADYKEDDYILATGVVTGSQLDVKDIKPAQTVSGKVSSFSTDNDVTIAGTSYKYNNNIVDDANNGKKVAYKINEDATVVLDSYGYIIYVDEAVASSDDVLFLRDFNGKAGDFKNDAKAKVVFADGTTEVITVKDAAESYAAGFYTYSKKSSGKYELTAIGDKAKSTAITAGTLFENGKSVVGTDTSKFNANKETKFIIYDDGDVTVYTGISSAPTVKYKSAKLTAYAKMDGGYAEYVYIDVTDASTTDANKESSDYIYLLKYDRTGTDSDENEYVQYKALVNGEETTVKLDKDEIASKFISNTNVVDKLYKSVRYDSTTGFVTDMDEVTSSDVDFAAAALDAVEVGYKAGVLNLGKDVTFVTADNCKVYLVVAAGVEGINDDTADYSVTATTASGLKSELKGYKVTGTYFAETDDDQLVNLYVYVSAATEVTLP